MSDGRIVRRLMPFEANFTQLPNAWIRDHSISLKARGLLALLMSYPDGHEVTAKKLQEDGHGGEALIASAVAELENAGYLARVARPRRGQFAGYDWELHEPISALAGGLQAPRDRPGFPGTENPGRRSTVPENPGRTVPENPGAYKNTRNTKNLPTRAPTVRRPWPVDNSGRALCPEGHPLVAANGEGRRLCALSHYEAEASA